MTAQAKIKNYQVIAPGTWNIGPRDGEGQLGPSGPYLKR